MANSLQMLERLLPNTNLGSIHDAMVWISRFPHSERKESYAGSLSCLHPPIPLVV